MNGNTYKVLKFIHVLAASVWIGAGATAFFLLTVMLDESNLTGILQAIHYIDLLIIIPANLVTFITGILFSKTGGWGFFKHPWIVAKYVINLIPMLAGGIVLPPILNMLAIVETMGSEALMSPEFIAAKNVFTTAFVIIMILLMLAVYLSVFKPKFRRKQLTQAQ
jgi:uncharacterized membrane protein